MSTENPAGAGADETVLHTVEGADVSRFFWTLPIPKRARSRTLTITDQGLQLEGPHFRREWRYATLIRYHHLRHHPWTVVQMRRGSWLTGSCITYPIDSAAEVRFWLDIAIALHGGPADVGSLEGFDAAQRIEPWPRWTRWAFPLSLVVALVTVFAIGQAALGGSDPDAATLAEHSTTSVSVEPPSEPTTEPLVVDLPAKPHVRFVAPMTTMYVTPEITIPPTTTAQTTPRISIDAVVPGAPCPTIGQVTVTMNAITIICMPTDVDGTAFDRPRWRRLT